MDWAGWRADNLANWEDRVDIHLGPRGYAVDALLADPARLSLTVANDRAALGDLTGLDVVHLQCHVGTDTLSLARLGARAVAGVDFSPKAIAHCRSLFARAGVAATFVQADVHDARAALPGHFDLVYASIGAINWIPSIGRWLAVAASLLRPGGRLVLRDIHPMAMVIDPDSDPDFRLRFDYGETLQPATLQDDQTYTGDGTPLAHRTTHEWSHGMGEIVQGALDAGFVITGLREDFFTEWQAFPSMVQTAPGRFELPDRPGRLPLLFLLTARLP